MKEALTAFVGFVLMMTMIALSVVMTALPFAVAIVIAVWMLKGCA